MLSKTKEGSSGVRWFLAANVDGGPEGTLGQGCAKVDARCGRGDGMKLPARRTLARVIRSASFAFCFRAHLWRWERSELEENDTREDLGPRCVEMGWKIRDRLDE